MKMPMFGTLFWAVLIIYLKRTFSRVVLKGPIIIVKIRVQMLL